MEFKPKWRYQLCCEGFTLLEMVIALALTSFIAVIVLGALRLGFRAWDKGETLIESQQSSRVVLDRLQRQLSEAVMDDSSMMTGTGVSGFNGDETTVQFTSAFAMDPTHGYGWVAISYKIERDAGGVNRLLLTEQNQIGLGSPSQTNEDLLSEAKELLHGFDGLHFTYLASDAGEPELRWESTWRFNEKKKLPRAVRISYSASGEPPLNVIAVLNPAS